MRFLCGRCRLWQGNREFAGVGNAIFLDVLDAIDQRRQELAGLVQVELEKMTLRKSRHGLCLSELSDQRGIGRHRNGEEMLPDRDAVHIEGLLAVEGEGDGK